MHYNCNCGLWGKIRGTTFVPPLEYGIRILNIKTETASYDKSIFQRKNIKITELQQNKVREICRKNNETDCTSSALPQIWYFTEVSHILIGFIFYAHIDKNHVSCTVTTRDWNLSLTTGQLTRNCNLILCNEMAWIRPHSAQNMLPCNLTWYKY